MFNRHGDQVLGYIMNYEGLSLCSKVGNIKCHAFKGGYIQCKISSVWGSKVIIYSE